MSQIIDVNIICPICKKTSTIKVYRSVNVTAHPYLKEQVFNGEIKKTKCSFCNTEININSPLLYHDMDNQFAILYDPYGAGTEHSPNFQGYLFDAPVVTSWSDFLGQIILFENRVLLVEKKNKYFSMKQRKNIDSFSEGLDFLFEDLQMKEWRCKFCNEVDYLNGLSENCSKCDKEIHNYSFHSLEYGLEILRLFCLQMNDTTKDSNEEIFRLIDKIISNYYFFKENNLEDLDLLKKFLNRIKVIGSMGMFFYIENDKIKLNFNKERINLLVEKLGDNEDAILFIIGALNLIFRFPKKVNDLRL